MKKIYPKNCVNNNCNKIVYTEKYNLHLPLQCESCINKKEEK